jgi:hypothetical protein
VLLEVREKYYVGCQHQENEWPIARTQYTRLYLDARTNRMQREPVTQPAACAYSSLGSGPGAHRAEFDFTFEQATELTGHMKLKLYMAAESADDMDIFVGVYKFNAQGELVPFAYYAYFDDGPVALGWLRASHRELDPAQSTEYQPVLAHQRELKLEPGKVEPLEIEIWPSGTLFEAGSRLRLIVQGSDIQKYSKIRHPVYTRHEDSVNHGRHVIHTGGATGSYLLVPVVPIR